MGPVLVDASSLRESKTTNFMLMLNFIISLSVPIRAPSILMLSKTLFFAPLDLFVCLSVSGLPFIRFPDTFFHKFVKRMKMLLSKFSASFLHVPLIYFVVSSYCKSWAYFVKPAYTFVPLRTASDSKTLPRGLRDLFMTMGKYDLLDRC